MDEARLRALKQEILDLPEGEQEAGVQAADTDLLSLGEIEGIPILDVPAFWRKLAEIAEPGAQG